MKKTEEHTFYGMEFFTLMKEEHLSKVVQEISLLKVLMRTPGNSENIYAQKDVQLSVISFLLRRCDELEYIQLEELRYKLNSILHAHKVYYLDNGGMHLLSDDDLKNERKGVTVDFDFIDNLEKQIENWRNTKLEGF